MEGGNFPTRLPSRSGADVTNNAANPSHEFAASTNARTAANPSHESTTSTNASTAANPSHESVASSNARTAANGNKGQQQQQRPPLLEREQFLPIANIIRIMRRMSPPYGKISDEAKETVRECVSEFISFITSEASEKCRRELRKTVTAEDLLQAMSQLGFDDYVGPLALYLNRYREVETGRTSIRGESLVRRRVEFEPPYGIMLPPPPPPMQPPMYGGAFDMGLPPLSGMFDAMGGRPMNDAEMGGPIYGPVPDDGTGKYYFGDGSGASSSSGYPPQPEFDPFAKFK